MSSNQSSNQSLQELCGFIPSSQLLGYELEEGMSSVSTSVKTKILAAFSKLSQCNYENLSDKLTDP